MPKLFPSRGVFLNHFANRAFQRLGVDLLHGSSAKAKLMLDHDRDALGSASALRLCCHDAACRRYTFHSLQRCPLISLATSRKSDYRSWPRGYDAPKNMRFCRSRCPIRAEAAVRKCLSWRSTLMKSDQPLFHRKVRAVHDHANRNGELLTAIATRPSAVAGSFAVQFVGFVRATAMRTNRAFRPAETFDFPARFLFEWLKLETIARQNYFEQNH